VRALVTFALQNEFGPWRKLRRFKRVPASDLDEVFVTQIGNIDVHAIVTGVGRFATERAMARPLQVRPDICIASGLAGSLKPAYGVGQVLAARAVAAVASDRTIFSDVSLVRQAEESGAKSVEKFLVSDHVISSKAEKVKLADFGDAVDMESSYVLGAAGRQRIPAIAIRAISDGAESDLPLDFDRVFNARGAVSISKVIGQTLKGPARIPGLLRLAHQSQRAAAALAEFLDRFFERLSDGPLTKNSQSAALAV
jgi:adenosylhomocysteine nucleosidase